MSNGVRLFQMFLAGGLVGLVGVGIVFAITATWELGIRERFMAKQRPDIEVTIDKRIDDLSSSLKSAASTIAEIEQEIASRQDLVEQLKRDADAAKEIANLHKEEVDAVAQLFQGALEKDDTKAFWLGFAQNTFFMLLGLTLGQIVNRWRRRPFWR